MVKIVVVNVSSILSFEANPGDNLQESVTRAVSSASKLCGEALDTLVVLNAETNQPIKITESRCVGEADIQVQVSGLTMKEQVGLLKAEVAQLRQAEEDNKVRIEILTKPTLINTAAQVLNLALGRATFRQTTTSHCSSLGENRPLVQKLAQVTLVDPCKFLKAAEDLITRRNNENYNEVAHFISKEALDKAVFECQSLITESLKQKCRWECWVIYHYADIQQVFTDGFQKQ